MSDPAGQVDQLLQEMYNGKSTVFSPRVERFLEGAKRAVATSSPVLKKAAQVDMEMLIELVKLHITDKTERGERLDLYKLRVVFRLVIICFTFCRLSDYRQLQASHVQIDTDKVQILFTAAKNDQYHNGQVTILPATLCPVRLTKIHFNAMGLRPGIDGQDTKHLHCRLRKLAGRWTAAEGGPASLLKGREELKELLREVGRQGRGITDKSF
jgi:hypothetical protein